MDDCLIFRLKYIFPSLHFAMGKGGGEGKEIEGEIERRGNREEGKREGV